MRKVSGSEGNEPGYTVNLRRPKGSVRQLDVFRLTLSPAQRQCVGGLWPRAWATDGRRAGAVKRRRERVSEGAAPGGRGLQGPAKHGGRSG